MPEIKILPEEVVSRIAAGEVVERPASALKELLENSLDAGASKITVDVEKAGKRLLRVYDDGVGMSPEDCRLAVVRHATSKISSIEDLDRLSTFGFRGEALYSVAAVSRLTIKTFSAGHTGWTMLVEGGKIIRETESPPVRGTTVEIRDIFFNTPARAKFLRSDPSERSHLLRAAEESALAHPETAYRINADGNEVYSLPAEPVPDSADALKNRAAAILGKNIAGSLIFTESCAGGLKICALFSRPEELVASRNMQYFFVNRRPVASRIMQQACYKAYENYRSGGRHPVCVVFLETDPAKFDVNIHPQKKDVRFENENDIYRALIAALSEKFSSGRPTVQLYGPGEALSAGTREAAGSPYPAAPQAASPDATSLDRILISQETGAAAPGEGEPLPSWYRPPFRFLGQIERSYLVFDSDGGILVLDQHAAAERVFFENYVGQLVQHNPPVQQLMLPVQVDLSASGMESLMKWRDWLLSAGFEFESFGANTVLVRAIPAVFEFGPEEIKEFVEKLSDVLGDPEKCAEEVKRETLATMACKKAVKAHDKLSPEEALGLLEDLKLCKDGFACPHGRPTLVALNRDELARRFRRSSAP